MSLTLLGDAAIKALVSVVIKDTYDGVKSIINKYISRTTLLSTERNLEDKIIYEVECGFRTIPTHFIRK